MEDQTETGGGTELLNGSDELVQLRFARVELRNQTPVVTNRKYGLRKRIECIKFEEELEKYRETELCETETRKCVEDCSSHP